MNIFTTKRYTFSFEEISKGGPGGYESVYLTSEGDPAKEELYSLLQSKNGKFLAAENKAIRQRNGSDFLTALKENKKMGIASGFKPSGAYHFGHKLTSSAVSFFQQNGVQVFMPVADLECMLDTKLSKEQYLYWAADNLLDWGANGVNLDVSHVYLQSEEHRVSNLAYLLARNLSLDLPIDIYGLDKMKDEFQFLFAGITQVADIALPQHSDFGNYHSFMVSGQDQDGHMKMTVELVKRALESKIELQGIQTVPSAFYIPHIRGIIGKASSSKPESTLYLGSGPEKQDLEGRVKKSLEKIDNAMKNPDLKENMKSGALDMVRYIDFFNSLSEIDFAEALNNMPENILVKLKEETDDSKKSALIDSYLIAECESRGQDNVEIVRESLKPAIVEHQKKRKQVLDYAILKKADYYKSEPPEFWDVPEESVVDESKRNATQWSDLVCSVKEKLIA